MILLQSPAIFTFISTSVLQGKIRPHDMAENSIVYGWSSIGLYDRTFSASYGSCEQYELVSIPITWGGPLIFKFSKIRVVSSNPHPKNIL